MPLGRTDITPSRLTLGTSGFARDPAGAAATLARATEAGVDTVELAADDEATLAILAAHGAKHLNLFVRATPAVPFDLPSPHVLADQAWPAAVLRAEVERLLVRLRIERIALLQIHAWCPEWLHEGAWRETVVALRREGKVAGFGVSLFDHDTPAAIEVADRGAVDAVQLLRNVFDPGDPDGLLATCAARGVGVIARAPLYYGALAPGFDPDALAPDDWRRAYFYPEHRAETQARAARIEGEDSAALSLRFALSHPAVATVAIGTTDPAHLAANLRALAQGPLPAETLARLAGHRWLC